jgi:hypothetical protein
MPRPEDSFSQPSAPFGAVWGYTRRLANRWEDIDLPTPESGARPSHRWCDIYYEEQERPPLLMLHGRALDLRLSIAAACAGIRLRTIAVDQKGFAAPLPDGDHHFRAAPSVGLMTT